MTDSIQYTGKKKKRGHHVTVLNGVDFHKKNIHFAMYEGVALSTLHETLKRWNWTPLILMLRVENCFARSNKRTLLVRHPSCAHKNTKLQIRAWCFNFKIGFNKSILLNHTLWIKIIYFMNNLLNNSAISRSFYFEA